MGTKYEGQRLGKLTVISGFIVYTTGGYTRQKFNVRCDCGAEFVIQAESALKSMEPMCAECRKEHRTAKSLEGYRHPLYTTWRAMISRCKSAGDPAYINYGARGITVCDRWCGPGAKLGGLEGFKLFVSDMGPRPSPGHSIGRINNDGPYSPENCRWETQEEQMNNTRANVNVNVNGVIKTVAQWGRVFGTGESWAAQARKHGVPLEDAAKKCLQHAPRRRWDWYELFGVQKPSPLHQKGVTDDEREFLRTLFDTGATT